MQAIPGSLEEVLQAAHAHHRAGRFVEAEAAYVQVLQRDPNAWGALYSLGVLYTQQKRYPAAIGLLRRLVHLFPTQPAYFQALASACRAAGQMGEAIAALDAARQLNPDDDVSYRDLALTYATMERFAEAVPLYQRTLELRALRQADDASPDERFIGAQIWLNLGVAYDRLGRTAEATAAHERAVALQPDFAAARMNLGHFYFRQGDLRRGFACYNARWKVDDFEDRWPDYPQPAWDGSDLAGRTVLLWYEQGLGDTIQFVRYARLVPERGGKAIVAVQPMLKSLLQQLEMPGLRVVVKGEEPKDFDVHLPLMSLPAVFGTTRETVPFRDGYLTADPGLATKWAQRIATLAPANNGDRRLRVGLVWAGSRGHKGDATRSIRLEMLRPLLSLRGAQFFSLQKGEASAEVQSLSPSGQIIDWTADLQDFADTAGLVANLDLVVAVDTAVAHLTGALGKEVWTLIAHDPDFRWLSDDEQTCWYSSMRLFRQPRPGDWISVIQHVADELKQKLAENSEGAIKLASSESALPTSTPENAAAASDQPVVSSDPVVIETLRLAQEHHMAGRFPEAERLYREALQREPANATALHYLGLIAHQTGRREEGLNLILRSVQVRPISPFLKNLAATYRDLGRTQEAIDTLHRAMALDPNDASSHYSLGFIFSRNGRLEEAAAEYQRAADLLSAQPIENLSPVAREFRAKVFGSLGATLGNLRRFDGAIAACDQAVAIQPDYALGHQNRGYAYFCKGDLLRAFEDYEWRWKCEGFQDVWPNYPQPLWDGSDPNGKTVLLWSEQGLGDTIHFSRYAPLVAQRGGRVLLMVPPPLKRLMEFSLEAPSLHVITREEPLPAFDAHLSLVSLPCAFRTTRATIPIAGGYLKADPNDVARWGERFAAEASSQIAAGLHPLSPVLRGEGKGEGPSADTRTRATGPSPLPSPPSTGEREEDARSTPAVSGENRPLRVGLVWAGSPDNKNDANRSLSLESLLPILKVPGVRFYSLQIGPAAEQLERFINQYPITDWTADLHDFADTAGLLPQLDLVISVDTAVVHLAGAMGKEAWVLISHKPDFRWACDTDRSGWYDSVRLFQQPGPGDWTSAIQKVADELQQRVSVGSSLPNENEPAPPQSPRPTPAAPTDPAILSTLRLAHEHHAKGELSRAEPLYRDVLARDPANADAMHHLGLVALQSGQTGPAIELMTRSIALAPDNPFFHKNLAAACRSAGEMDDAIDWLRRGIAVAPDEPSMHEELGVIFEKLDRLDESIAEHNKAIEAIAAKSGTSEPARPGLEAKAYLNLGAALLRQRRFDEAMPCFDRAIELVPDYALAHTHRATVLFRRRELPAAWAEYEWRFRCKNFPTRWRSYPRPTWDGSDLAGRTILIWPEQGLGDVIQFARFVPEVAARGGRVILECPPLLKRVLRTLPVPVTVIGTGEPTPSFDTHLPMLSVPRVLGTTYETIPAPQSYLRADAELFEKWGQRIRGMGASPMVDQVRNENTGGAPVPRTLRVGVVWSGSASFGANYRRSIPIEDLAALGDVPGVEWHSLQLGEASGQVRSVADRLPMIDHSAELRDFADTAALLANLDLLISTDTATVHLAGALGKETWVLLWTERDYRWLIDDAPQTRWYPSLRIFQQAKARQWSDVVEQVRAALVERVKRRG